MFYKIALLGLIISQTVSVRYLSTAEPLISVEKRAMDEFHDLCKVQKDFQWNKTASIGESTAGNLKQYQVKLIVKKLFFDVKKSRTIKKYYITFEQDISIQESPIYFLSCDSNDINIEDVLASRGTSYEELKSQTQQEQENYEKKQRNEDL